MGSLRRDYMRIMEENMSILKRIQDRKPNYQRSKWEKDRGAVEGYLKNIRNDATTGYLSRSSSKLPMSPMSASSSRSSVSSSRKRLHRLPPMEGSERREVRTAPSAHAVEQPSYEEPLMGEINPLPRTATAPGQTEYRVTTGGEVERTEFAASHTRSTVRPGSAVPLFKKGYKIGGGHYLVQFFCDELGDGSTSLRIRGIQIGSPHEGEMMEWAFSGARLAQMFGSPQPWTSERDPAAWFNAFLVQLKEEDAVRSKTPL